MPTPKVGCSTLKLVLQALEGLPEPERWGDVHDDGPWESMQLSSFSPAQVEELLTAPDVLRFAFVRNPYARLLSGWASKIASRNPDHFVPLRELLAARYDGPAARGTRAPFAAFRDFADFVLTADDAFARDHHWAPQHELLRTDIVSYDVLGCFETFAEDLSAILRRLDAPEAVVGRASQRVNSTFTVPLTTAYDADLADRVYHHYEADFEAFGYDRDSWAFEL